MHSQSLTYSVTAFNTAAASENKIHDDAIAGKFGFTGGLVPGVDDFAYMSHVPAVMWGREWMAQGRIQARFLKPVYDGDAVSVAGEGAGDAMRLALTARGILCADGAADRRSAAKPLEVPAAPFGDYPNRPAASAESLREGTVLGTISEFYYADTARSYLRDVRESHDVFDEGRIAPPGFLLRRANSVLAYGVRLGPWIHVESDVSMHSHLKDGEPFESRARVARNYESKGHLIVDLDFAVLARGRPVMSGRHTAIYAPRQVREAAA